MTRHLFTAALLTALIGLSGCTYLSRVSQVAMDPSLPIGSPKDHPTQVAFSINASPTLNGNPNSLDISADHENALEPSPYGYDPNEQLQTTHQSRPNRQATQVEDFKYDKAGNLFDGPKLNGLIKHNRVLVYQDKRYRYDRFGRLCEKRIGSHWVQYFEYDAEHRLICVDQCKSLLRERVVFGYDPLGRRISKEIYQEEHPEPTRRTLFHWQGLRLLQEVQRGLSSVYVYASPDNYEPLARIDGKPGQEDLQYFHTNLAGLPEQLTDADGETLWRSDYRGWGTSRDEWHSQRQTREQNLRHQGQYLDRETCLHYNTFRYLDPQIGRFTQCDPISLKGGINLYLYAPNPLLWIDPFGWSPCNLLPNGTQVLEFERALSKLPANERVALIREMASSVASARNWKRATKIERFNRGRTIYTDGKHYYSVDTQHGRFEQSSLKNGKHVGEVDMSLKPILNSLDPSGGHDLRVK